MKRFISILLVLAMVFCLVACGSDKQNEQSNENKNASTNSTANTEKNDNADKNVDADTSAQFTEQNNSSENTNLQEANTEETNTEETNTEETNTEENNTEENTVAEFVLNYPEDMQTLGYTEPVVLDKVPERVVALSAAPVLALYELGVNLVGVPNSRVVKWPDDLATNAATVSFSVMSPEDFDYESVVSLEPDLVLLAMNGADSAGAKLESLGIPVYYLYAGHTVPYSSIKMQTEALAEAFDNGSGAGQKLTDAFSQLEKEVEIAKNAFAGTKVMVLQSGSSDMHYIQTNKGTLGSMLDMIGFENVYENEASSMVQLDYEQALDYDPDYVVCVGGTDAATHQAVMEEAFSSNPDYWNVIDAIKEGRVIYVDVTYCSTAGINVIDNTKALIDIMAEATGISIK